MTQAGIILQRENEIWTRVYGRASKIAIGGDGSIFILGKEKRDGAGYEIFEFDR